MRGHRQKSDQETRQYGISRVKNGHKRPVVMKEDKDHAAAKKKQEQPAVFGTQEQLEIARRGPITCC